MAKYVPDLQEEFRKRFPRFSKGELATARLSPASNEFSASPRFDFQTKDGTCGVVVLTDSVTLHVSRYESFQQFCRVYRYVLDTLNKVVSLGLIERIGLRYVDLV